MTALREKDRPFLCKNFKNICYFRYETLSQSFEGNKRRENTEFQNTYLNVASEQSAITLASLSALIRGKRSHKGIPREPSMSRRWEAVKGRSKHAFSNLPCRAFSALNANNAITTAVRWQLRASSDIIHVSVGFGGGSGLGETEN